MGTRTLGVGALGLGLVSGIMRLQLRGFDLEFTALKRPFKGFRVSRVQGLRN